MAKKAKVPKPPKGYGIVRGKPRQGDIACFVDADGHERNWEKAHIVKGLIERYPHSSVFTSGGTWYLARKIKRKPAPLAPSRVERGGGTGGGGVGQGVL